MRATELECQAAIVEAAKLAGWRVHGERTSLTESGRYLTAIQGHKGWPDLVLCRPPRLMFVELKRKPNKIQTEQQEWLRRLELCGVETRIVWVPEGQDEFIADLVKR